MMMLISGLLRRQPSSRLPLLSTRPAVTFPVSERHWPITIAWLTEEHVRECLA